MMKAMEIDDDQLDHVAAGMVSIPPEDNEPRRQETGAGSSEDAIAVWLSETVESVGTLPDAIGATFNRRW